MIGNILCIRDLNKKGDNIVIRKQNKYPYEEYHKEINGLLYKKCAHHERLYGEEKWFPATLEYFYKNDKNKKDGLCPECKLCTYKSARKWAIENPEKKRVSVRKNGRTEKTKQYHNNKSKRLRNNGYYKKWYQENPDRLKLYNQKRTKKNHIITNEEWYECKKYFNYSCAYCGMTEENHRQKFGTDLHKEHVIDDGRNDIKNCIPSCTTCNNKKKRYTLNEFYNPKNINYTYERYYKIYIWIRYDCKKYAQKKKPKRQYKRKEKIDDKDIN